MHRRLIACGIGFALLGLSACGGGGGNNNPGPVGTPTPTLIPDPLVLLRTDTEGIDQTDILNANNSDIDVCETLSCADGESESFGITRMNAVLMNQRAEAITLQRYTVTITNSGISPTTRSINTTIPGGHCESDPSTTCVLNSSCPASGDTCIHPEVPVTLQLYSLEQKVTLRNNRRCEELIVGNDGSTELRPATIQPRVFDITIETFFLCNFILIFF